MHKIHLYLANRLFYPIELLFVIAIIAVLMLIAVSEYEVPKLKAYMTGALSTATVIKEEITLYHALTGIWPDKKDIKHVFVAANGEPIYDGVDVKNGSFKVPFDTHNVKFGIRELAFHRVEFPDARTATVLWTCGSGDYSPGAVVHREFKSDLDNRYLLSICKTKVE